jgi:hypothetical protein
MSEIPTIEAELTLLPTDEGGRRHQLSFGRDSPGYYFPHVVVGDPAQRKSVVHDGNVCTEDYLSTSRSNRRLRGGCSAIYRRRPVMRSTQRVAELPCSPESFLI